MEILSSSETEASVVNFVRDVRNSSIPLLNDKLCRTSLRDLSLTVHYVPIIVNKEISKFHSPRSRINRKKHTYTCAPQLKYEVFRDGKWNEMVSCFLEGLQECAMRLQDFGAPTGSDVKFLEVLESVIFELKR